jgi:drug/metabolite transporter (DMT)-like permease
MVVSANHGEADASSAGRASATLMGQLAIVFWGTTVALARGLSERFGAVGAAGMIYGVAGVISAIYLLARRDRLRQALSLPRKYLCGCGAIFAIYTTCLYLGLGLARGRQQSIEVGTINYLWTVATVAFSVPLLGRRARWMLAPGVLLAVAGIGLTAVGKGEWSWPVLRENLASNWLPYALALFAGILWGLYSNLSRRWAPGAGGSAVPLFLIATALVVNLLALLTPARPASWTGRAVLELLYMGTVPTLAGYALWEVAMRRGNVTLVGVFSYLTPVLSAAIAALYLGVAPGAALWIGCGLIVVGALVCKRSVLEPASEAAGRNG